MFELKNKVALITGVSRGMGKSHALALARRGAKVVSPTRAPRSASW